MRFEFFTNESNLPGAAGRFLLGKNSPVAGRTDFLLSPILCDNELTGVEWTVSEDSVLNEAKIKLSKWQRVFVNRSLNMANIRAIGFDMDHTLALYNRDAFETLAFRKTLEKFIANGYPAELEQLRFDPNYVMRGLLVDRERGNLLKVDGHKYVKLAFHGHRKLSKEERHTLYNAESFKAAELLSIDTFFALSEVQLFVEIVDYMARNPGKITKTFAQVYQDLRHFIDLSHRDGSIKNEVIAHPEKFIELDKYLPDALVRLIESGKALFLLTNSTYDYTNVIMNYVLQGKHEDFPDWRDYFQYVFVGAGKPAFFTGSQPFYEVVTDTGLLRLHDGSLVERAVYHGGNANSFQRLTGIHGDEILYVGDHLYGDIIRSKSKFNWRTMLCVEELNTELPKLEECKELTSQIVASVSLLEACDEDLHMLSNKLRNYSEQIERATKRGDKKKAQYLTVEQEKLRERHTALTAEHEGLRAKTKALIAERESRIHPVWGELMKVGLEKSRFAQQLEQYACLYTSRASNFRFYSPFKRFTSALDTLPHDV
jgi:HAD superfamily 5'-nucleotidase-like hydrolase